MHQRRLVFLVLGCRQLVLQVCLRLRSLLSVLHWYRSTSEDTHRTIQKRGTGGWGSQAGWQISHSTGTTDWGNTGVDDGTNYVRLANATEFNIQDGLWHHMVVMWDATAQDLIIYIDDVLQSPTLTKSGTVGDVTTTRNLTIACAWNDASTQSQFLATRFLRAFSARAFVLCAITMTAQHSRSYSLLGNKVPFPEMRGS